MEHLSLIGERGLIIFDNDSFKVVAEEDWRSLPSFTVTANTGTPVGELVKLKAAVASLEQDSAYVDLDRLAELPAPLTTTSNPSPQPGPVAIAKRSVVLREGDNFFVIPEDMWKPIDAAIAGDARVLVNRGALVAAVPKSDVPSGTFCVLVNFTALADS